MGRPQSAKNVFKTYNADSVCQQKTQRNHKNIQIPILPIFFVHHIKSNQRNDNPYCDMGGKNTEKPIQKSAPV